MNKHIAREEILIYKNEIIDIVCKIVYIYIQGEKYGTDEY